MNSTSFFWLCFNEAIRTVQITHMSCVCGWHLISVGGTGLEHGPRDSQADFPPLTALGTKHGPQDRQVYLQAPGLVSAATSMSGLTFPGTGPDFLIWKWHSFAHRGTKWFWGFRNQTQLFPVAHSCPHHNGHWAIAAQERGLACCRLNEWMSACSTPLNLWLIHETVSYGCEDLLNLASTFTCTSYSWNAQLWVQPDFENLFWDPLRAELELRTWGWPQEAGEQGIEGGGAVEGCPSLLWVREGWFQLGTLEVYRMPPRIVFWKMGGGGHPSAGFFFHCRILLGDLYLPLLSCLVALGGLGRSSEAEKLLLKVAQVTLSQDSPPHCSWNQRGDQGV